MADSNVAVKPPQPVAMPVSEAGAGAGVGEPEPALFESNPAPSKEPFDPTKLFTKADSSKARSNMDPVALATLRRWFVAHWDKPYPTGAEKESLARQVRMGKPQVHNWFVNTRARIWKPYLKSQQLNRKTQLAAEDGGIAAVAAVAVTPQAPKVTHIAPTAAVLPPEWGSPLAGAGGASEDEEDEVAADVADNDFGVPPSRRAGRHSPTPFPPVKLAKAPEMGPPEAKRRRTLEKEGFSLAVVYEEVLVWSPQLAKYLKQGENLLSRLKKNKGRKAVEKMSKEVTRFLNLEPTFASLDHKIHVLTGDALSALVLAGTTSDTGESSAVMVKKLTKTKPGISKLLKVMDSVAAAIDKTNGTKKRAAAAKKKKNNNNKAPAGAHLVSAVDGVAVSVLEWSSSTLRLLSSRPCLRDLEAAVAAFQAIPTHEGTPGAAAALEAYATLSAMCTKASAWLAKFHGEWSGEGGVTVAQLATHCHLVDTYEARVADVELARRTLSSLVTLSQTFLSRVSALLGDGGIPAYALPPDTTSAPLARSLPYAVASVLRCRLVTPGARAMLPPPPPPVAAPAPRLHPTNDEYFKWPVALDATVDTLRKLHMMGCTLFAEDNPETKALHHLAQSPAEAARKPWNVTDVAVAVQRLALVITQADAFTARVYRLAEATMPCAPMAPARMLQEAEDLLVEATGLYNYGRTHLAAVVGHLLPFLFEATAGLTEVVSQLKAPSGVTHWSIKP